MSAAVVPKASRYDYEGYAKERRDEIRSFVESFTRNPFPHNFFPRYHEPYLFDQYRYTKQREHETLMEAQKRERERLYEQNKEHLDQLIGEANRFLDKRGRLSDLREALLLRDRALHAHERDIFNEKMSTVEEQKRILQEIASRGKDQMDRLDRMILALENAVEEKTKKLRNLNVEIPDENQMDLTPLSNAVRFIRASDDDDALRKAERLLSNPSDSTNDSTKEKAIDESLKEFAFDYLRLIDPANPWKKILDEPQKLLGYPGMLKIPRKDDATKNQISVLKQILKDGKVNRLGIYLSHYLRKQYGIYTAIDVPVFLETGWSRSSLRIDKENAFFTGNIKIQMYTRNQKRTALAASSSADKSETFFLRGNDNIPEQTIEFKPFPQGKTGKRDMNEWSSSKNPATVYYVIITKEVTSENVDKIMRAFHGVKNVCILRQEQLKNKREIMLAVAAYCHTKLFHYKKYTLEQCVNMHKSGNIDDTSLRGKTKKSVENMLTLLKDKIKTKSAYTGDFIRKTSFPYPVHTGLSMYTSFFHKTIPANPSSPSRGDSAIQVVYPWIARDLFYTMACGYGTHFMSVFGISTDKQFDSIKRLLEYPDLTLYESQDPEAVLNALTRNKANELRPGWSDQIKINESHPMVKLFFEASYLQHGNPNFIINLDYYLHKID